MCTSKKRNEETRKRRFENIYEKRTSTMFVIYRSEPIRSRILRKRERLGSKVERLRVIVQPELGLPKVEKLNRIKTFSIEHEGVHCVRAVYATSSNIVFVPYQFRIEGKTRWARPSITSTIHRRPFSSIFKRPKR